MAMALPGAPGSVTPQRSLRQRLVNYALLLTSLVLLVFSYYHLRLPIERLPDGVREIVSMLTQRMFPPDFGYASSRLLHPFLETFAMAFIGTIVGILVAVPLAWWAAANMTPSRWVLYPLARLILIATRSVHEVIWAMLAVAIFGFGPLAGTLVLVLVFIGFAGKLLAENVEAIDMRPVEAMAAVGANRFRQMVLAVYPQVRPVWIGIFIYGWDIVLRASFVLGIVGAGGIGAELTRSIESLAYDRVGMILLIIILVVTLGELLSMRARRKAT